MPGLALNVAYRQTPLIYRSEVPLTGPAMPPEPRGSCSSFPGRPRLLPGRLPSPLGHGRGKPYGLLRGSVLARSECCGIPPFASSAPFGSLFASFWFCLLGVLGFCPVVSLHPWAMDGVHLWPPRGFSLSPIKTLRNFPSLRWLASLSLRFPFVLLSVLVSYRVVCLHPWALDGASPRAS